MVKTMKQNRLSLNDAEWGEFKISNLFEIELSKGDNKADLLNVGRIPLISSGLNKNGITKFVDSGDGKSEIIANNTITVDMFGQSFYHYYNYYAVSHGRVNILHPNFKANKFILLFCVDSINKSTCNIFSYNRMCSSTRLSKLRILLPIDNFRNPNWQFMEDYIKQEQKDIAQKVISYYEQKMLETSFDLVGFGDVEWREFNFNDVFRKIQRGKRLKKDDHIEGNIPYISSTSLNNGLDQFIGNEDKVRKFKNNITLANSGSVGSCFYHEYEYIASDHVTSLTLDKADKYIYLFMATIIKRLEEKYSFNREINDKRIRKERFILPADENGNPHWDYISKFMQKLEAEKLEKVLEYIYIYRLAISYDSKLIQLHKKELKEFWLEDIIYIKSGVRLTKANQRDGNIPFIGSTDNCNGITNFINNKNSSLDNNVLGVNYNGSVVENFYHPYEAIFSDDVKRIHWLDKNQEDRYTYLFLKQAILQQKVKYAYGYKFNAGRMKRQKIMLPVKEDGTADYDYMRQYIQIEEIKQSYKILDYYREI